MTVDEIIDGILAREGGFNDRQADKGGATNFGITEATLGMWRVLGRPATRDEVKALKESEARDIYAAEYISRPGFGEIWFSPLKVLLVDAGVNHGVPRAVQMLQRALGFTGRAIDGIVGKDTREAVAALSVPRAREVCVHVLKQRADLYLTLALDGPDVKQFLKDHPTSQLVFLRGWVRRVLEFTT